MTENSSVGTYNLLAVLAAAIGSFTFGFTVNVTGPVLGMPSFYEYFDLNINQTTGVIGGEIYLARNSQTPPNPISYSYPRMLFWWWDCRRHVGRLGS